MSVCRLEISLQLGSLHYILLNFNPGLLSDHFWGIFLTVTFSKTTYIWQPSGFLNRKHSHANFFHFNLQRHKGEKKKLQSLKRRKSPLTENKHERLETVTSFKVQSFSCSRGSELQTESFLTCESRWKRRMRELRQSGPSGQTLERLLWILLLFRNKPPKLSHLEWNHRMLQTWAQTTNTLMVRLGKTLEMWDENKKKKIKLRRLWCEVSKVFEVSEITSMN